MATVTIYNDYTGEDGSIDSYDDASYASANAGSGESITAYVAPTNCIVGQAKYDPAYSVFESFLSFDTSVIPDGASVTSATLSFYVVSYPPSASEDFTIEVRSTDWNTTLTTGDWLPAASLTDTLLASLDTSTIAATGWNALTSETDFLTAINKTGITRVSVSSSETRTSTTPSGDDYVEFNNTSGRTNYPPKLVVVYSDVGTTQTASPSGLSSKEGLGRGTLLDGDGLPFIKKGIWIHNSAVNVNISDDSRFRVLADTDFGQVSFSVDENINPLADVDGQMNDSWGKLREITLRVRIYGSSMEVLMANAEWLQREITRDDEWWLEAQRDTSQPWSYFRILKASPFNVPYNMMALARKKVDVEIKLLAEPYVYGEETLIVSNSSMTAPGTISIDTVNGTFPVPLNVKIAYGSTPHDGPLYYGLSEVALSSLEVHCEDMTNEDSMTAVSGGTGERATNAMKTGGIGSVYRLSYASAPTGIYRVLLRCRDDDTEEGRSVMSAAVTDTTFSTDAGTRFWREFQWGDDAGSYGWSWLDIGEWQSTGGRTFVLWLKAAATVQFDSVIFLPAEGGVLGTCQEMYKPGLYGFHTAATEIEYDYPYLYEDESLLTRASYGSGVIVTPGTTLGKYLVIVASQDRSATSSISDATTTSLTVTVSYVPRYSTWVTS